MTDFYKKNKTKFVIAVSFAAFIYFFVWSILKPYNYGPDEYIRYPAYFYMFTHNALPDGNIAELRNNVWGFSYAFYYTWFPGLLSVFFMKIVSIFSTSHEALLYAARFPGAIAGSVVVGLIFLILDKILDDERVKWIITFMLALIPQLAFLSSYVNNDIYALAGAMLTVYAWVSIDKEELNIKNSIIIGAGISIMALSYYNSYGWILCSLFFFIFIFVRDKDKRKKAIKCFLIAFAIVIFCTGFFIVRNTIINHGDVTGLISVNKSAELYAIDELKPDARNNLKNQGLPFWAIFKDKEYFFSTERGFIGVFGYMEFTIPGIFYKIYRYTSLLGFLATIVGVIISLIKKNGKKYPLYVLSFLVLGSLIATFLGLYYTWGTDYQPQGRYFYPVFPALVVIIGYGYDFLFSLIGSKKSNSEKDTADANEKKNDVPVTSEKTKEKPSEVIKNIITACMMLMYLAINIYCFAFVYIPSYFPLADMSNLNELNVLW